MTNPAAVCNERLVLRRRARAQCERRDELIGHARVAVFAAALVMLYLALGRDLFSAAWALAALPAFVALVILHSRNDLAARRIDRAIAHYEHSLARIEDRWAGRGDGGERHLDPTHPYAADLDLFGKGSLFELLCTCRTEAGEQTLTRWLLTPAPAAEVRARQQAVVELRDRVDLREELFALGEDVRAQVDSKVLARWAAMPPRLGNPALPWLLGAISVASSVLLVAFFTGRLPGSPPIVTVIVAAAALGEWLVTRLLRDQVEPITDAVVRPGRDLQVLAQVLARFEREPVSAPRLVELQRRVASGTGGDPASVRIARLARLVNLLLEKNNQFFVPIAYLLLWEAQFAIAIERWRRRNAPAVADWIAAMGELEALAALSGHAWERPEDPFPEVLDGGDDVVVEGEALGHPLLGAAQCVRNDVRLDSARPLLLISGSNMSGKSTLLRTVGTNVVLALAGAPVRATRMRLCPVQIGATLRVQDSLQEGASRFYAEIKRLRVLVDLAARRPPLLFLLDELLAGTNSHDRRIGAEAVIRGLLAQGSLGFATTHDLALAKLVDSLAPRAENVHFEDHLEDGVLKFDYRMRPGVVRKSNALELMRAIGLPIETP